MKVLITGGPSAGKTTIIHLLAQRGFTVVEEVATQIIKEGVFLPWVDRASFQSEVLRRQVEAEKSVDLSGDELIFLDRGLFDGEAYYIYDKLEPPTEFARLDAAQYSVAFMVDELPFFEKTDVRWEDIEFARGLTAVLEKCYTSRNVPVVHVPAFSPSERVDFVLSEVRRIQRSQTLEKVSMLRRLSALLSAQTLAAAPAV